MNIDKRKIVLHSEVVTEEIRTKKVSQTTLNAFDFEYVELLYKGVSKNHCDLILCYNKDRNNGKLYLGNWNN